ncbi:hypothetical protein LCGC14_1923490 [marine sediment metagenome]|uniref:Uncharacterized protein n=1 Tax=marine sediment metagenome TaxID=412755 RepID=A0A0F9FPV3_9ZZZZ
MVKFKMPPGLYLIRVEDNGNMTYWNCKDASDSGYTLIDMVTGTIQFNYIPIRDTKEVSNGKVKRR